MNQIPRVSKLSSAVWRILGCNPGPMTLQGTNIYLVGTGRKRLLIDAGQKGFPEYVSNLSKLLKDENVTIEKTVITHWHADHISGLSDLTSLLKDSIVSKFPRDDDDPEYKALKPISDNQKIDVEGATLRVIHTPGHTADHCILYLEEEKAVFSADCVLGEGTTVFEDLHDYMLSLNKILDLNPSIIYPGHGPIIENPKEVLEHYISHRIGRENSILQVLSTGEKTPSELVEIIYKETPKHLHPAAEFNVRHHLSKLLKEKKIRQREDTFFIQGNKL